MKYDHAARLMIDAARLDTEPFFESSGKLHSRFSEVVFRDLNNSDVKLLAEELNSACKDVLAHWSLMLSKKAIDAIKG